MHPHAVKFLLHRGGNKLFVKHDGWMQVDFESRSSSLLEDHYPIWHATASSSIISDVSILSPCLVKETATPTPFVFLLL